MAKIKVLGLCGSLRAESYNLKLLRNFVSALPGATFETSIYPTLDMPLMNEDLEKKPLPQPILDFRAALSAAPVIVLACPEYNGGITGPLKNAIDWGTRPPANLWQDKIAVLLSASPGSLGGARGLIQVRTILSGIKTWVIPEQVQLSAAHEAFETPGGTLKVEGVHKQIQGAIQSLEVFTKKMLP
ncbi:MAG: NADPH-dependent FMN reductase [Bdellovibrionota bacterium]